MEVFGGFMYTKNLTFAKIHLTEGSKNRTLLRTDTGGMRAAMLRKRRWKSAVKRADIRRRNPYHTRHTYACWMLTAGANPSFIANQVA